MTPPEPETPVALSPDLRFLRGLVVTLTAVMIFGVIAIVVLLVIRLNADPTPGLVYPTDLPLAPGETLTGYAQTAGGTIVLVTDTPEILLVSPDGQTVTARIPID